jgi:hypothetical protein
MAWHLAIGSKNRDWWTLSDRPMVRMWFHHERLHLAANPSVVVVAVLLLASPLTTRSPVAHGHALPNDPDNTHSTIITTKLTLTATVSQSSEPNYASPSSLAADGTEHGETIQHPG